MIESVKSQKSIQIERLAIDGNKILMALTLATFETKMTATINK